MITLNNIHELLGAFPQIAKSAVELRNVCLSLCIYHWGSHPSDFREMLYRILPRKSVWKLQFWLKPDKNISHFAHRPTRKYVCTADSSTKHFSSTTAQTELLHVFLCHQSKVCIVDCYTYFKNKTKGKYFSLSVAKTVNRTHHNITLYVRFLHCWI